MAQINESAIKTPGVYVNEIPSFPPSVAQVATAVPVFIGYTQKADRLQTGDLNLKPTRLSSLVEYNHYFGFGPEPKISQVDVDGNFVVTGVINEATYFLYDSIRMFFLNGGGICYVCSIGIFKAAATYDKEDFAKGLDAIKKYDEPTLLLFPDAVHLNAPDFYTFQKAALKQCNDLQDRFCIFDLQETPDWQTGVDDFRDSIGMLFLNYGAAYTPYLHTTLGLAVTYRNLATKVMQAGVALNFADLTLRDEVKNTISSYDKLIGDSATLQTGIEGLLTDENKTLQQQWQTLRNAYQASFNSSGPADTESKFQAMFDFLYSVANKIDDWARTTGGLQGDFSGQGIKRDVQLAITNSLKDAMASLLAYDRGASSLFTEGYYTGNRDATLTNDFTAAQWGDVFAAGLPAANTAIYGAAPEPSQRMRAIPSLNNVFAKFDLAVTQSLNFLSGYESNYEQSLLQSHPVYKQIVAAVQNAQSSLPPSGAVAGIYATVDGTRGVWKAPANVSLNGVSGLTKTIDDAMQDTLNVDVTAGKSVNAIRAFTGKGILVWGGRTLDGNSNDWRYIPVRRFYIMVEESVKKATMQFVFEPNDANTWVRVRAMIENYLTNLWRLGALAGPKPELAFYVKVGLGQTMTFQDVLEGRMIVEIGMAPVRPAEFIILRFSQIQQQA